MIDERDDDLIHLPETDAPGWFDRFWVNAHAVDGRTTISQGLGVYPNVGVMDGEEIIIDPTSWRASRDRSWGLRPETKACFNWVSAQTPSFHVWYLAVDDEAGVQRFAQGWMRHAEHQGGTVEKIERIVRRPTFDEGSVFRSAEVEIGTTGGATHRLAVRRLDSTVFLRGGLYGGWKGWRQGDRKGALYMEAERWNLTDADTVRAAAGLNDHLCEFRAGDEIGHGIFELNHGT